MTKLYDNEAQVLLGQITEDQLQFLVDHLEETEASDRDYYLDSATLDLLEADGADPTLLQILRGALGNRDGIDIRWETS